MGLVVYNCVSADSKIIKKNPTIERKSGSSSDYVEIGLELFLQRKIEFLDTIHQ